MNKKYYVYILKSVSHDRIYIGSTQNFENRLKLHNSGRVKSTKAYKPWQLLELHRYESRSEAVKYKQYFKTGQLRELIRQRNRL